MKTLELDQITYCGDGSIGLRLFKTVTLDGEVLYREPHRVTVMPDQTVGEVMAVVNEALARDEGYAPLAAQEIIHADSVRTLALSSPAVAARRDEWLQKAADARAAQAAEAKAAARA